MPALSKEDVKAFFGRDDLQVFTDTEELKTFLKSQNWFNANLLMMSSGTFGGMDFQAFSDEILSLPVTTDLIVSEIPKDKKWSGIFGAIVDKFKK
jgi:UDP-N-acetylmuramate: L-alanyl-gamma-D-glutamyl-meso-diaminopimelate ligase